MIFFWDTSALVPLHVHQLYDSEMKTLFSRHGSGAIVWTLTPVEYQSALARLERTGFLDSVTRREASRLFKESLCQLTMITNLEEVKIQAERLLNIYPLKAADSLQLAAAITVCLGRPSGHTFVTLDQNLAVCAYKEGFFVLPEGILKNAPF